jgi:hypothetical protein
MYPQYLTVYTVRFSISLLIFCPYHVTNSDMLKLPIISGFCQFLILSSVVSVLYG